MNEGVSLEQSPGIHPAGKADSAALCLSFCGPQLRDFFFFEVFIEFVVILLLFYVLVFWPGDMWDLKPLTRDRTCTPCRVEGEVLKPLGHQESPGIRAFHGESAPDVLGMRIDRLLGDQGSG